MRELLNKLLPINGCFPVIVKTEYAKNKFHLGIQFWNDQLIARGKNQNPDKTWSYLEYVK
jgi:hypothetical protein